MNCGNEFENENRYKLFRTLYEVIHPTISKRNISNYKIVLDDGLAPIRVFYPKKISSLKSLIIYIHGIGSVTECDGNYANICREIVTNTERLVLAIDYDKYVFPNTLNECYKVVKYIYDNCSNYGIETKNIILMGDSLGGTICTAINYMARDKDEFNIKKMILLYPILSGIYTDKSKYESIINYNDINKQTVILLNEVMNKYIIDKKDYNNKLAIPLIEDNYKKLSNIYIIFGNTDPLHNECMDFYERISKVNKKCDYLAVNFANHGFINSTDVDIKNELYRGIINFISK